VPEQPLDEAVAALKQEKRLYRELFHQTGIGRTPISSAAVSP